ncbi:MAG: hypothetical protein A2Z14_04355 [Chloroflexi bacterium RBG_16_48_8]|nr:MAG: hypothetical protein A2Z14_04355 [Chloroflexi bacterium RBG_16_48_8]
MTMAKGLPSNLIVPPESFSAERLTRQAQEFGYAQANTLEALIWDYELYAQLQQRASKSCRLKGGAAVQLYVTGGRQRASIDIDVLTTLSQREMHQMLEDISNAYSAEEPYLQFVLYIPDEPTAIEGLNSYTTLAPSSLGQKWHLEDGTLVEARMIKVDIHETPSLPHGESRDGVAAGIPLGYQPLCVRRGYLIAEKLLTQARGTVGVPDDRYQDLPKHLYDLDSLLLSTEVVESLEEASDWLPMLIGEQGKQWQGDSSVERVLDDLETSLLNLAIIDYSDERQRYGSAVQRLDTLYLPGGSRMRLHQWATMAARTLGIVRLFKLRIMGEEKTIQDLYPQADRLAGEIRSHTEASKLTRTLCELLPDPLRRMRQLRGSPPERLFWILVTWENLRELNEIISEGKQEPSEIPWK